MFSIPQPSPEESPVEGCALVCLPDSAEEVETVLRALYFHTMDNQLPFPIVEIYLRLGRKYDIRYLMDKAVHSLTSGYPTTLEERDTISNCRKFKAPTPAMIDVLNIAREYSIQTLLPFAYFTCTRYLEDFALGMTREDGSLAKLDNDALGICIIARRRIHEALRLHTLSWLMKDMKISTHCAHEGICSGHRNTFIKWSFRSSIDPVRAALEKRKLSVYHSELCLFCLTVVERLHQAGREKMWELLPSFFGLPPWDELKNLE